MLPSKIGSTVKVIQDRYADYGFFLGKIGVIIAGGAKFQGITRFLVDFGNRDQVHVFEPDLEIIKG